MDQRRGEKIGWTAGWFGGFCWVLILAVVLLVQGRLAMGVWGLIVFSAAAALILGAAPWRHPDAQQWKLMTPLYVMLVVAVGWAIRAYGGAGETGLDWWNLVWAAPLLIPLFTAGRRTWHDGLNQRRGQ